MAWKEEMGLAELLPGLAVFNGFLQNRAPNAEGLGSDADAAAIQRGQHLLETFARLSQQVFLGDPGIFENQFRRSGSIDAEFFLDRSHIESRGVLEIDDKGADPLVALALVGNGGEHTVIGDVAVGDEFLRRR